jgi:hypothetical protein
MTELAELIYFYLFCSFQFLIQAFNFVSEISNLNFRFVQFADELRVDIFDIRTFDVRTLHRFDETVRLFFLLEIGRHEICKSLQVVGQIVRQRVQRRDQVRQRRHDALVRVDQLATDGRQVVFVDRFARINV